MFKEGKAHGIMRIEWPNGTVSEETFYENMRHGLVRRIDERMVTVQLWQLGTPLFEFTFNEDFMEIGRKLVAPAFTGLDWQFMDDVYGYRFSKVRKDSIALYILFNTRPASLGNVGLPFEHQALWDRMYRLNETFFQTYWDAMSASTPMVDWATMEYAEWSNNENVRYYGCRSLKSNARTATGIVRKIDTDANQIVSVEELSMNQYGGQHGFHRNIFYNGKVEAPSYFVELQVHSDSG
jgi:hypothetical protein